MTTAGYFRFRAFLTDLEAGLVFGLTCGLTYVSKRAFWVLRFA